MAVTVALLMLGCTSVVSRMPGATLLIGVLLPAALAAAPATNRASKPSGNILMAESGSGLDSTIDADGTSKPECHERDTADAARNRTCLPNFLVLGPQKTGTSALYEYLRVHPQMRLSRAKELLHWGHPNHGQFDCSPKFSSTYIRDFENVTEGYMTGDFTASDISCVCCAVAASSLIPHARLIVIMRDPIARALSRYKEQFAHVESYLGEHPEMSELVGGDLDGAIGCDSACLKGTMSNYTAIALGPLDACLKSAGTVEARAECAEADQIIGWSMYSTMVDHWLTHFPISQMMLIRSEALESRTLATLRGVEGFLGLGSATYPGHLLNTEFNTGTSYGWHNGEFVAPARYVSAASVDISCGEECEAAARLSDAEHACLSQFYEAHRSTLGPADSFFASTADFCLGEECEPSEPLEPPAAFDAAGCVATAAAVARSRA